MKKIAKDFNLVKSDYYKHKQSGKYITTKEAIEKIWSESGIKLVSVQVLNSERDFVRLLITMSLGENTMSSIGEADGKLNCLGNKYYGCMAEKRGIGRVVLKLIGASQHGIMSEEDFSNQTNKSFDDDLPTHKTSSVVKSEVSGNSPLPTSLAWREEKFMPLQTKIRNCSNDDVKHWFRKKEDITDKRSAELVVLECEHRIELAKKKGKK
tara:strand:- start:3609 stop:4238 length:630 start_codon:yes stop_codon:yes gene_type:complete